MKKWIISIIIVLIILLLILGFVFIKPNKKTGDKIQKVRVNEVIRSVFYAPQYIAIENGYFKEEGLEIDLTTGQGADKVMTAVLSNQSDIGFCGPEAAIYVYNEGKEDYVQVFAQLTKRDGAFLVSKNKTDNFSWKDLKGKTVIPGRKGGVPYMTFEYVLKKNGIKPNVDVKLDDSIKFDLMAGAFSAGDAEYVTLFEPTASMTESANKGYIVASIGKESGEVPYTAYMCKKSYMERNKDIIEKFTRAIYKGQKWVKEHKAIEIADKIEKYFPNSKMEYLERSIQSYKDIDAWNENPVLKEESFNKLQEIMQEAGELEKKASYKDIVNNDYANRVIKE